METGFCHLECHFPGGWWAKVDEPVQWVLAPYKAPARAVSGMFHWKETSGQTQDRLFRSWMGAYVDHHGGAGICGIQI